MGFILNFRNELSTDTNNDIVLQAVKNVISAHPSLLVRVSSDGTSQIQPTAVNWKSTLSRATRIHKLKSCGDDGNVTLNTPALADACARPSAARRAKTRSEQPNPIALTVSWQPRTVLHHARKHAMDENRLQRSEADGQQPRPMKDISHVHLPPRPRRCGAPGETSRERERGSKVCNKPTSLSKPAHRPFIHTREPST